MGIIIFILFFTFTFSQENQPYPPLDLISIPSSGTLPKGAFSLETLLMNNGGIQPKFLLGVTENFTFGVSWGVQRFIGTGDFEKNKDTPEIHIKYRLYEETETMPAVAIGMNTQGRGEFIEKRDRYEEKAIGVYVVLSRNWNLLGNLGFHIGVNKNTFEKPDIDTNLFFGFDKEINKSFSLLAEYNFSRNDDGENNSEDFIRDNKGYLNAGLRWSATENLMLEINVNDILENNTYKLDEELFTSNNREVKIMYYEQF
mgnify:FL=1